MRETKIYCDHCRKLIDSKKEPCDNISWFKDFQPDLCHSCAKEIVDFVYDFFHIKEEKKMRDMLIELLRQPIPIIKGYATVGETRVSIVDAEKIADHLLANGAVIIDPQKYPPINNQRIIKTILGASLDEMADLIDAKQEGRIIVPPCKVGDTVYTIDTYNMEVVEWSFCLQMIDTIGKTVFLTREEAEKALKEARSNG